MKVNTRTIALAVLLSTTAAYGASLPLTTLYNGPYWSVAYSSTANSCVLATNLSSPNGDQGMITVKYFANTDNLALQIFKASWRFPPQGVSIPVTVWFDKKPTYTGNGTGYVAQTERGWPFVEIDVKPGVSVEFIEWFAAANYLSVQFMQGTEAPWQTTLVGSREATTVFAKCVGSIHKPATATQPYGSTTPPTQPYSAPTQRYGSQPKKPVGEPI
jgi:hypothetical protein